MTVAGWLPVVVLSFSTFELHRYAPGTAFLVPAVAALWFGHRPAVRKCFLLSGHFEDFWERRAANAA